MEKTLKKQIEIVKKQEEKFLNKKGNQLINTKLNPLMNKIEAIIPDKLKDTLDCTFYKGFQLVFEKGSKYIEKTYNKDKIKLQYDLNNYAVERKLCKKYLNKLDKQANTSNMVNSSISVAEGTILGLLGIGLPDIPLFISVIIKTIYEITLSYGFDYESEQEKCYVLLVICVAMTKEEEQKEFNCQLKLLEEKMKSNIDIEVNLKKQIKITSHVLSNALLTVKFIQGLPIIGVVGGVVNHTIVKKIGKFAALKYKKRYLMEKSKH